MYVYNCKPLTKGIKCLNGNDYLHFEKKYFEIYTNNFNIKILKFKIKIKTGSMNKSNLIL